MEAAKLRAYATGYDRRRSSRRRELLALADRAREAVPRLARICRRYGATRVRLFGSLVTGHLGATPDIDLAVEGIAPARYFDLYGDLLMAAPVSVDLVDLSAAPASLVARVKEDGHDV